ncbi:AHCY transcriptional activator hvrB [Candidatus Rhodobacter oscarellae]|uniref:AHCY transcriptional activator hvrB n=1 Tax=Candidatus Rhodobacter oscarellae TaxID=1675527 RepID=A0A0J9E1L9_9RHOB|nr:AHCY transcriptional activator hvrB [Candidatus Rhodobacter lobularis]
MAQLRAFAALAESGAISKAGALLNVSHAAISQQVRALEAHLGQQLIERDGRGTRLTDAGARLGEALTEGFGRMTREIEALTGADADRALQITTTPMFAQAWLMPRLTSFRAQHPDIDLMMNPTAEPLALEPGGLDLAIRFGNGTWPGLEAQLLVATDFVIAGARSLVGDCDVQRPEDLLDFPWLQEFGTTEINDWLSRHGVVKGHVKSLTTLPGNLVLDGLRSGQGIVAATRAFIEPDLERGDLVVLFQGNDLGTGYFLVHRPGVMRPKARAFARWLRNEAKAG